MLQDVKLSNLRRFLWILKILSTKFNFRIAEKGGLSPGTKTPLFFVFRSHIQLPLNHMATDCSCCHICQLAFFFIVLKLSLSKVYEENSVDQLNGRSPLPPTCVIIKRMNITNQFDFFFVFVSPLSHNISSVKYFVIETCEFNSGGLNCAKRERKDFHEIWEGFRLVLICKFRKINSLRLIADTLRC